MVMEISGTRVIEDLLHILLKALSEYKEKGFNFSRIATVNKHLLRFLGVTPNDELPPNQRDDYSLILLALDFIVQQSDRDLIRLHKEFTDFSFN